MSEPPSSLVRCGRRGGRRADPGLRHGRILASCFTLMALSLCLLVVTVLPGAGCSAGAGGSDGAAGSRPTGAGSGPSTTATSAVETSSPLVTGPTASSSTTTSTIANLPPRKLTIKVNPQIANLEIGFQDGTYLTGKSPFSEQVPGGRLSIEFTKKGYNTATRELTLDKDTSLSVWLDPVGQLYESLVRFKCGPEPQTGGVHPRRQGDVGVASRRLRSGGISTRPPARSSTV